MKLTPAEVLFHIFGVDKETEAAKTFSLVSLLLIILNENILKNVRDDMVQFDIFN